ncbi:Histone H2A deubiquitinase [Heracleum sosnowskyi]|uniref:Histone H2A deubiquitinase n=1 Tax=Heracleum sosnowskyi TaxID=360622 RepID=A0AAD8MW56_9APIA|nr:Histone H2A deubiquitinase [Heracleum sosnowskyi]
MASESNTGFYHEQTFGSAANQHAISFQSSAMDSTSEMIMMGNYYGTSSSEGMMFSGNSIGNPGSSVTQAANSSSSLMTDTVPGLKHDAGLAVEWSVEEQYRLEEGLVKYADEPSIMRYIKVAATLRDKTVRDVAMRCRWMLRKRRKQDDYNFGKKVNDRKDKFTELSPKASTSSVSPSLNVVGYSGTRKHQNGTGLMSREAANGARNLLEQNNEALGRISVNLSTLQLQDNIDLFCRTRNNITAILNNMSNLPGIMSRMPALPLSINNELANSILPGTSQTMMFGLPNEIRLKQESR